MRMLLHDALALAVDDDLRPIPVQADPCGLAVDPRSNALYVADAYGGAILRIDGHRHRRLATITTAAALAITPYGTLFATQTQYGVGGSIVRIDPDGSLETFDKLSPQHRRLGVTYDPHEHALYATQFLVSSRGSAYDGSVVIVDLVTGDPSTVIDGFAKPVGIVKLGSTLVVADARQRAVFRVELVAGRAVQRLQLVGDIGRPDSLAVCGRDSVLVTSFDEESARGSVRRLWLDGRTQGIASGPWEPRGVATDGERVFVAARRAGKVLVFDL